MIRRLSTILLSTALLTACSSPARSLIEPMNAKALVVIAKIFNDDYGRNDDGPVYDRWDTRSRTLIERSDYIRRHTECPTAPSQEAHVEGAVRGSNGVWLVKYQIGHMQFTDYWYYVHGRWVFDLPQSNPVAARLYRLSSVEYATEIGCNVN